MTKKKVYPVPVESKTQAIEDDTSYYLDRVSDLDVSSILSFEEASVTKTATNRRYGNAAIGSPAFEIQRSASNATYTIYPLHSCLWVDYVNVLEGASNGNELLSFFEEAVEITRRDGSVLLKRGDTVIIDNCPFHHARYTKNVLTGMLAEYGVSCCFNQRTIRILTPVSFSQYKLNVSGKRNRNRHTVIIQSGCFRHCGYLIWRFFFLNLCGSKLDDNLGSIVY